MTKGLKKFGKIIYRVPKVLVHCDSLKDDIKLIKEWSKIFENPILAGLKLAENLVDHANIVVDDLKIAVQNFRDGQFYDYGT